MQTTRIRPFALAHWHLHTLLASDVCLAFVSSLIFMYYVLMMCCCLEKCHSDLRSCFSSSSSPKSRRGGTRVETKCPCARNNNNNKKIIGPFCCITVFLSRRGGRAETTPKRRPGVVVPCVPQHCPDVITFTSHLSVHQPVADDI